MLLRLPGYFATKSYEKIKIYDVNGYNCVNTLVGHDDYVSCMLFIKGNKIVTSSIDKTTIIWKY
jgi:WD40 repeat protein